MTPILAAFMWFAAPAPLDMPRAEAYLVTDSTGRMFLEDRFDSLDLWTSKTVLGRWTDDDGRVFTIAKLATAAPITGESRVTRSQYEATARRLDPKDAALRDYAISLLTPFQVPEDPARPKQMPRGLRDMFYVQGTNTSSIACAFLPEAPRVWHVVLWELLPDDDAAAALSEFEEDFLRRWGEIAEKELPSERDAVERDAADAKRAKRSSRTARVSKPGERELLRADARHSVTNYATWHVTDGREFTILDDLPDGRAFVASLTNDMSKMRARYTEVVPSPLDGSNVLAVARIFRDRYEYLSALDVNEVEGMEWSAAYWDPLRRELVAHLPSDGGGKLIKTIRHEAFHQYLSYACSMISASPWFNEGYAQYFENEDATDWGVEVDLDALHDALPALMAMNYAEFYSGTDVERRLKYRTAWSVAKFLEAGAPKVRFNPFKNYKKDYVRILIERRDPSRATFEAFGSEENLRKFADEWKKYWEER